MTRTTPQLAPPSPNFRTTPAGGRLAFYCPVFLATIVGSRDNKQCLTALRLGPRSYLSLLQGAIKELKKSEKRFDAVDTSPVFQQLKKGQNRIMDAITCVSKEIEIVNGQYRHVCFKEEGKYVS
ncbi:hypothetical protein AVEN_96165-2 [Araneus ventricosus]|uniref:Uncharacterized protein n=1 Tax=Araneus ventricosus TaxID=182803 RepID=A0A4Y2H8Q5_ARAVE|nr:hypothetical protein AVEN_96165-2 [Araneus ventricosus]